jgi:membrane fusion protein, copper/silver efflux system
VSRSAWLAGTLAAFAAGGVGYVAGHGAPAVPAFVERARSEFVPALVERVPVRFAG